MSSISLMSKTSLSELLQILASEGEELRVVGGSQELSFRSLAPISEAKFGDLTWVGPHLLEPLATIAESAASIILCQEGIHDAISDSIASEAKCLIFSKNVKLTLARLLGVLAPPQRVIQNPSPIVDPGASIGSDVSFGVGVVVGKATIADGVRIGNFVSIADSVVLRKGVLVDSHTIIGGFGFNYAEDESGRYHRLAHLGGVQIGQNCEIGAFSYICSGVLSETVLGSGSKLGQYVYIGANSFIGSECQIRARASVMGSVKIGDRAILGPSATVRDHLTIGEGSVIGMGSVVTDMVQPFAKVYGVPARPKNV